MLKAWLETVGRPIHLHLATASATGFSAFTIFNTEISGSWKYAPTLTMSRVITPLIAICIVFSPFTRAWNPIVIKNVTTLGSQLSSGVTDVSRDGGYSVLINGNIVWLYDDTECMDLEGDQLSFVSNTAAYQKSNNNNVSTVTDFGVVNLGKDKNGSPKTAILAGTTVGTGGWIPFQPDELDFNQQMSGKERVAICETPPSHDFFKCLTLMVDQSQGQEHLQRPSVPHKRSSTRLWSMSTTSRKIRRRNTSRGA